MPFDADLSPSVNATSYTLGGTPDTMADPATDIVDPEVEEESKKDLHDDQEKEDGDAPKDRLNQVYWTIFLIGKMCANVPRTLVSSSVPSA